MAFQHPMFSQSNAGIFQQHFMQPCNAPPMTASPQLSGTGGEFSDTDSDQSPRGEDGLPRLSRKRRRGMIEKRRRDRINACLAELRRLVPTAFERQGSQKLEKAEILQLTVQHLAHIQSKGLESVVNGDSNRLASDYHSMGFRECASEVARYLSVAEGLDLQDPLRMRLMSHLQCYSAQRTSSSPAPLPPTPRPTSIFPPGTGLAEGGTDNYSLQPNDVPWPRH